MALAYKDLLGDSWHELPPGVRLSLEVPLTAKGVLKIDRPETLGGRTLAKVMKLPPAGDAISATLQVSETEKGFEWIRTFDDMRAVSIHRIEGSVIREVAGPFTLLLSLTANHGSLIIKQEGVSFAGVKMPHFLGPTIEAHIGGAGEKAWQVRVDISHIWLGSICRYEGVMEAR